MALKVSLNPDDIITETGFSDSEFFLVKGGLEAPLRFLSILIFFLTLTVLLVLFLVRVKVVQGEDALLKQGLAQARRISWQYAPRGVITDRNGVALAANRPQYRIGLELVRIPIDPAGLDKYTDKIAGLVGLDRSVVLEQIQRAQSNGELRLILINGLNWERFSVLRSRVESLDGLFFENYWARSYPLGEAASHLVGYTGRVTPEELNVTDFLPDDVVGRTGVEAYYDRLLRGEHGYKIWEANARGVPDALISTRPSRAGENLVLSVESRLQKFLYERLDRQLKQIGSKAGAAVALDPISGEVLALVSLPSFDDNIFDIGDRMAINSLFSSPDKPLFNRVISGKYPSGSTFKLIVALAALSEKIIDPYQKVPVPGSISLPSRFNPSVVYTFRDWKPHGVVDMVRAIAVSSNVYFYRLGGGYKDFKGLGAKKIASYAKKFGFGEPTGIDLPGETAGLVPTPEWKLDALDEPWFIGDTYSLSIGQGFVQLTPLQLARYTALLANGGKLITPHILKDSRAPTVAEIASKRDIDPIIKGMHASTFLGAGQLLQSVGVPVAGKTGTAQTGAESKPHSWYTSFAPVDDPEVVVTVMVEFGGEGYQAALPVAKDFLKFYFNEYRNN